MARKVLVAAAVLLLLAGAASLLLASKDQVREPAVAGAFYPADRAALSAEVAELLAKADRRQQTGRLIGLIAPHAGYPYSGQVAAQAYAHITDRPVDTVILIGSSHAAAYAGAAVYADGVWNTPLGPVRIDRELGRSLVNERAGVTANRAVFAKEHSLEVQLPFLQQTL